MSTSSSSRAALLMGWAPGKPSTRAVLGLPGAHRLDVQPAGSVDAAEPSRMTATTREPRCGDQGRHGDPGVAEALDRDRGAIEVEADVASRLDDGHDRAAAGSLDAALGAAQADGLAGDDGGDGVPDVHRVGVHDPGHRLGVRVHVRGRDVPLRADEDADLGRVAARQPFELTPGEQLGIDAHAALAAAEWDGHDGAFPGHPHGQGTNLVEASRPGGSADHPWRGRGPGCAGRGSPERPRTLPSSMRTGTETMSSRSHSRRTARRAGSRSSRSAAMSNWRCAVAQGSTAGTT